MLKNRRITGWGVTMTLTLLMAISALGQMFEVSRNTIDGGGAMRSTGGDFELSGTIGQADAGFGGSGMSGGGLALTGGFWFALRPGDCNEDGGVTLFDYVAFEPCFNGVDGNPLTAECRCFDMDRNDTVDLRDFALFLQGFGGSGTP